VTQHITYREERYDTAAGCIRGIRDLVALGWSVVEVRGAAGGPFLVVWRKDGVS
jgi:hypothetical protein